MPPDGALMALLSATDQGWLYNLLHSAGVSPHTDHTVVDLVVKPLEVLLVILVAFLVAYFGSRLIRRVLGAAAKSSPFNEAHRNARAVSLVALISSLWRGVVVVIAFAVALDVLGVNLTPLLASATVVGATLGFGCQAAIRDYLSGIMLTLEDQFAIGDVITIPEVNGVATGVVEELRLRVTRLRAQDGTIFYVPNGDIRLLANKSRGWAKAVVDLQMTVPPGLDFEAVKTALANAAHDVAQAPRFASTSPQPPEVLGVIASDATSVTVRTMVRTVPTHRDALERALRQSLIETAVAQGCWPVAPAVVPAEAQPAQAQPAEAQPDAG
jgi:small-conductance mechanosensitive channel